MRIDFRTADDHQPCEKITDPNFFLPEDNYVFQQELGKTYILNPCANRN